MSPLQRYGFKAGEFIVYPAHGVGQISGIEEQEIAGTTLELLIINFEKSKMTLRIPTSKCANFRPEEGAMLADENCGEVVPVI